MILTLRLQIDKTIFLFVSLLNINMGKKKYGKAREIRQISEIEPEIKFDENNENSASIKDIKINLAMWEFGQNDPKRYNYISNAIQK